MHDRTPVPQTIARRLQGMIQSGELKAEEMIPSQRILSEQLGVSRASLREALMTLETLGLVRTRPGRGTFVTGPSSLQSPETGDWRYADDFTMKEVFETRILLEARMAAIAADTMGKAEISALNEATDAMESAWKTDDLVGNVEADLAFHRCIADRCDNRLLLRTYNSISELLTESQRQPIPFTEPERMQGSLAEHRRIIAAIHARDAGAAEAEMAGHIRNTAACGGVIV